MDKSPFQRVAGRDLGAEMCRGSSPRLWPPAAVVGSFCGNHARRLGAGWFLLLGLATVANGQEAVRLSMAGEAAAAAQRRANSTIGYYNLKLGPTAWNFNAGLGVDYNSNVNYTEDDPEADFVIRPTVGARMLWPVTDRNSINLNLSGGYSMYLTHSELSGPYMNPGSGLSFDLYVKDFLINFHDRFSIIEYSYQDPTLAGRGDYAYLENALGTSVLWDLNKVVLRFGYDHVNYVNLVSDNNQPDLATEVASLSAGYAPKADMLAGLEVGGGLLDYTGETTLYSNAKQWNVGGFYDAKMTEYMHLTAHVGYNVFSPESGQGTTSSQATPYQTEFGGIYAELDLTHRLNEYLSYTLSGGRTVDLYYYSGTAERYFARLSAGWKILRKVTLTTFLSYEHGTQLSGYAETWDLYGLGMSLERGITSKLFASLGYQYYPRQSDVQGRSYDVSIVSLNFNYRF